MQIPLTVQAAYIRYSPQESTIHTQTHADAPTLNTCHQNHNSSQIFFDFWLATSSLDSLCIAHLIDLDSEVIPFCRCLYLFLRPSPSLFRLRSFYGLLHTNSGLCGFLLLKMAYFVFLRTELKFNTHTYSASLNKRIWLSQVNVPGLKS